MTERFLQSDPTAPAPPGGHAVSGAGPLLVRDRHGRLWICPGEVDEDGDLAAQGCWRRDTPPLADLAGGGHRDREDER